MTSNSQLRALSRNQLDNRIFSGTWITMVILCLVTSAIPAAINGIPAIGSIISLLITGPLTLGLAAVCLMIVRSGGKPELKYIVYGFSKANFLRSFLISLLTAIFVVLWSILFVIPGIVKTYAYSAAYYIALDDDSNRMTAKECLDRSQQLMKGHKWQLFMLDLSFIGWYILGALAFGVGILFVIPYHQMARTNFYDKLVNG